MTNTLDRDVGQVLAALEQGPATFLELHQRVGTLTNRRLTRALEDAIGTGRVVDLGHVGHGRMGRYAMSDNYQGNQPDTASAVPSPTHRSPREIWQDIERAMVEARGLGMRPLPPPNRVGPVLRKVRSLLAEYGVALTLATERDELIEPVAPPAAIIALGTSLVALGVELRGREEREAKETKL